MKVILPLLLLGILKAETLTFEVPAVDPPSTEGFHLGTTTKPDGRTIGTNSLHLTLDGKPWMPVMGEFHFTRTPEEEWREELLRMKAGGIDIVATYVFWNHHEEEEGVWRWDGRRDLRKFISLCKETGMFASVRLGPWCHGEVRNGGVPDWATAREWKLRSNDPAYLKHVDTIYGQIANQLEGLLWKDGGPVIMAQVENEYRGSAEHLLTLRKIAIDAGIDVPIYTRTGWPALSSPMPYGEILPLFGAYAEGFWDRKLRSMPGKYWAAFRFLKTRTDAAIATEQLGERAARDESDAHRYPYLTCELGGGMVSSYHRRILIRPEDVVAVALTKVGSGGNLPGYYMYHGGANPDGRLHTLNEVQSSPMTNYNDMPPVSYDFQAPLGTFGQTRDHYHSLRRMHLLFRDFGPVLATMPAVFPTTLPDGERDTNTLRAALRTDGSSGFLFVNNHQRGATMPVHRDVTFSARLGGRSVTVPGEPVTIPSGAHFIWPIGMELGEGVRIEHATAQPICMIGDKETRTFFFAEIPGIPSRFTFADGTTETLRPGRGIALDKGGTGSRIRIVLLDDGDSLALWKGELAGRERVVLSRADVIFDGGELHLRSENPDEFTASVYPPLDPAAASDGIFGKATVPAIVPKSPEPALEQIRNAGPAREVRLGRAKVAEAPDDDDFKDAAAWRIRLPSDFDPATTDALLRINYRGDVARVSIGGKVAMDDYHNGRVFEIGLRRFADALDDSKELLLEILPFRADAPVFHPERPAEGAAPLLSLDSVELVPLHRVVVK